MKAQFVRENLEFERRSSTYDKISIGQTPYILSKMREYAKEFGWIEVPIPENPHPEKATGEAHAKWSNISGEKLTFITTFPGYELKGVGNSAVLVEKPDYIRHIPSTKMDIEPAGPWATRERWEKLSEVNESKNLEFKRGRDPKSSMGIGGQHHIMHAIENLKDFDTDDRIDLHMVDLLDSGEEKMLEIIAGLDDTKDDMKYLLQNADLWKYFNYSEVYRDVAGKTFYYLLKPKYKELFKDLSILKDFNESVSFKRGRDPKRSMDIGIRWKLERWRKYESYTDWTEYRLYKGEDLYARGSTLKHDDVPYYKNMYAFLKAHGVAKKELAEIEDIG